MKGFPLGELCVAHDEATGVWAVVVCDGAGFFQPLQSFPTREPAIHFATEEAARRQTAIGKPVAVHFPNDCPCYCNINAHL